MMLNLQLWRSLQKSKDGPLLDELEALLKPLVEKEAFVQPKNEQLSRAHYSPGLKGALVPGRKAQSPCEAGLPLVPGRYEPLVPGQATTRDKRVWGRRQDL